MSNEEQQKILEDQDKIINAMQDDFRQIGDFAEGLNGMLQHVLTGMTEATVVDLTLQKIVELVDQNL